jgi:hypothetical protein
MALAKIDSESDDSTDKGTKLKDGPEDTERFSFVIFERITHHDTSLGRPKKSGGNTKKCTGENQEPACTLGLVTCGEKSERERESLSN